jgi:hypothetical protein
MLNEKETSSWNARSTECQTLDENLGTTQKRPRLLVVRLPVMDPGSKPTKTSGRQ